MPSSRPRGRHAHRTPVPPAAAAPSCGDEMQCVPPLATNPNSLQQPPSRGCGPVPGTLLQSRVPARGTGGCERLQLKTTVHCRMSSRVRALTHATRRSPRGTFRCACRGICPEALLLRSPPMARRNARRPHGLCHPCKTCLGACDERSIYKPLPYIAFWGFVPAPGMPWCAAH